MTKADYLKLALGWGLYRKKAWVLEAFSVTRPRELTPEQCYPGRLVSEPWGYSFYQEDGTLMKIDDALPNLPLYHFHERYIVDKTMAANVTDPTETQLGNILFNAICILSTFGAKFPFAFGRVSITALEEKIAEKLRSTPAKEADRSNEFYYVDEYCRFVDGLQYLSMFTQISTWSATRKVITPPPGFYEFKKTIDAKYEGRLNDPVELSKYEAELVAFDDKYLAGDPATGTFLVGKLKNVARKKMFLALGAEAGFKPSMSVTPVTSSLQEGWSRDPVQFTSMMNGIRVGAYGRGAETIKGGVSAKYILRAANNYRIVDKDCGTQLGILRDIRKGEIEQLIGRRVLDKGKTVYVENKSIAENYVGQRVYVRSPQYCRSSGETLCKACAGDKLSQFPDGLTIPLTEVSFILLYTSMSKMHGSVLSTAKLDLQTAFT